MKSRMRLFTDTETRPFKVGRGQEWGKKSTGSPVRQPSTGLPPASHTSSSSSGSSPVPHATTLLQQVTTHPISKHVTTHPSPNHVTVYVQEERGSRATG
eukprot:185640-Rhodomonas_salina.3